MEELVLVVPTKLFHELGLFQGLSRDLGRYEPLFAANAAHFMPRAQAEDDPSFKQLIPYVVLRAGDQIFHLKQADEKDASIEFVDQGEHFHLYLQTDDAAGFADTLKNNGVPLLRDVHKTEWGTREFVIKDDQGHTLYFGESL